MDTGAACLPPALVGGGMVSALLGCWAVLTEGHCLQMCSVQLTERSVCLGYNTSCDRERSAGTDVTSYQLLPEGLAAFSQAHDIAVANTLEDVEHEVEDWLPSESPKQQHETRKRTPRPKVTDKRKPRRQEYSVFQKECKRNRGKTRRRVIIGRNLLTNPSHPKGTSRFWMDLFSRLSLHENRQLIPLRALPVEDIVGIVIEDEMATALASTPKTIPPGPDSRTAADLRALGPRRLA